MIRCLIISKSARVAKRWVTSIESEEFLRDLGDKRKFHCRSIKYYLGMIGCNHWTGGCGGRER
ncbi:hypothetical protein BDW74DRAFT_153370 [Aspergillus multicolor]|uniref:uncharacterized protein n=1 Tax=Aspergillus multicolor TaxID=41759 RepID=UPI003CCE3FE7